MSGQIKYIFLLIITGLMAALIAEYIAQATSHKTLATVRKENANHRRSMVNFVEGLRMELRLNDQTRIIRRSGEETSGLTPTEND